MTEEQIRLEKTLSTIRILVGLHVVEGGPVDCQKRGREIVCGLAQIIQEVAIMHCRKDVEAAIKMVSAAINVTNERAQAKVRPR